MVSNVLGGELMIIMVTRPDKKPNLAVSPMLKTKDKPYFADAFPYLMLSRFFLTQFLSKYPYLIIVSNACNGVGVLFSSRRTFFQGERKRDCFKQSLFRE